MYGLAKNILKNTYNRKKNMAVVVLILFLTTIVMCILDKANLVVTGKDYYFIVYFVMSLYYIYFIEELAVEEIENRTIVVYYSCGCSRSSYALLKINSFYLQGAFHGFIVWFWYLLMTMGIWKQFEKGIGFEAVLIYGMIVGLVGSIDMICALINMKRAQIVLVNVFIFIVGPVILDAMVVAIKNDIFSAFIEWSIFGLVSNIGINLSIGFESVLVNLFTGIVLGVGLFYLNKRKNF